MVFYLKKHKKLLKIEKGEAKYNDRDSSSIISNNRCYLKYLRKALPHEIPQTEFKTLVAGQGVSVDTRYNEITISLQDVVSVTKQEYKVEDGYLPYPEPIVSLQSILSQLND